MTPSRVIIVGGGLAGMAAAVALETRGVRVTLIEARKQLGGRAGSFIDPQTDETLDNCQHVLLGCCTNLIDFYRRIGAIDHIRFEPAIIFRTPAGQRYALSGVKGLPAPLHLGPSLLGFKMLTWAERIALSRAMLAMMRIGRAGRAAFIDQTFGDWLDAHHQPQSLITKLYDPIIISALNEDTRKVGADHAIQVFQDALLTNRAGNVLGLPATTLGALYASFHCDDLRLSTRVTTLRFQGNAIVGVELQDGQMLTADAVILATNYHALQKWIPDNLRATDSRFSRLSDLQSVPILGAHLWFDRPVLSDSHAAFIEGPLQWAFRKDATGASVHGVISAAREWAVIPKEQALARFEQQICRTLPEARHARLLRGHIVIEKRATFSPVPGIDRSRPTQAPPPDGIQNLYLAGDYTQTTWPATMEGAVRSGYRAADAIARSTETPIIPDLPEEWPARLLVRSTAQQLARAAAAPLSADNL